MRVTHVLKKPQVYLASGWFNEKQKIQMDEIYSVLSTLELAGHIHVFAPYYDGMVLKKDDPNLRKKMRNVWNLDIAMLEKSDLVVASTQDHDVGTIFETGYASKCHIPILCYNSNPELGLNLMLSQEAKGFIKDRVDLSSALYCFITHLNEGRKRNEFCWNLFEGTPI